MWKLILIFLRRNWKWVVMILLSVGLAFSISYGVKSRRAYVREHDNVRALTRDLALTVTKYGETVATVEELQYTVEEFRQRQAQDAALIKKLKIRASEVREVVKTVTETKIVYRDSLVLIAPQKYEWNKDTRWWSVHQKIDMTQPVPVTDFNFVTRDSLTHVLYKVPKCKFLGIHWGVKCYEIKVVNHNPNSTITYSRWINVSKRNEKRSRE